MVLADQQASAWIIVLQGFGTVIGAAIGLLGTWLVTTRLKRNEFIHQNVIEKRAEIVAEIIHDMRAFREYRLGEFFDRMNRHYSKVLCWFDDEQCNVFRNYLAEFCRNPSGYGLSWPTFSEPVIASFVKAIRPGSNLLDNEGVSSTGDKNGEKVRILPLMVFEAHSAHDH